MPHHVGRPVGGILHVVAEVSVADMCDDPHRTSLPRPLCLGCPGASNDQKSGRMRQVSVGECLQDDLWSSDAPAGSTYGVGVSTGQDTESCPTREGHPVTCSLIPWARSVRSNETESMTTCWLPGQVRVDSGVMVKETLVRPLRTGNSAVA